MLYARSNFFLHSLLGSAKWGSPHATCVHVTQKFTEATDGHFLVRVTPPNGDTEVEFPKKKGFGPFRRKRIDVCIPVAAAKGLVTAVDQTRHTHLPTEGLLCVGRNTDAESVEFLAWTGQQYISVSAKVEETKYPKTEGVVKAAVRRRPKSVVAFSPRLMSKLCSYLEKVGASQVLLEIRKPEEAMVLRAKAGTNEVLMLLMPMKVFDEKKEFKGVSEAQPAEDDTGSPEFGECGENDEDDDTEADLEDRTHAISEVVGKKALEDEENG